MGKKGYLIILIVLGLFILSACSDKTANSQSSQVDTENNGNQIPEAARTFEGMHEQQEGILVKNHIDPEIEIVNGWNSDKYNSFYDETFQPIAEKELHAYFSKNKDLTSDEVYDYLVYMLGSGRYKEYYKKLTSYEHGFEMPVLPDGSNQVETKENIINAVILIDASGSMKGEVSGGSKMSHAKDTIAKFVEQMPEGANVSLIAYGHVGTGHDSVKVNSCAAIETVYPLKPYEAASFGQALNSFNESGWTPLAGAIEQAYEQLKSYNTDDYYNVVYILSDGIEICGGDPVAAAKKLQQSNSKAKVNIIGFDVNEEGQQQLKEVADAGGGIYATVRDKSELETQVLEKWRPAIGQLFSTEGVGIKETTDAMKRLNDIYNSLYYASDREKNRIKNAAYFLNEENLITDEVKAKILSTADKMAGIRNGRFKEIRDTKDVEMWAAKDEINQKVNELREAWEEKLGEDAYDPLKQ